MYGCVNISDWGIHRVTVLMVRLCQLRAKAATDMHIRMCAAKLQSNFIKMPGRLFIPTVQ